jgi:hypothetical protein
VEAFELAASAAVKKRTNLRKFEKSRFETAEPLLMQGVKGKEVRWEFAKRLYSNSLDQKSGALTAENRLTFTNVSAGDQHHP